MIVIVPMYAAFVHSSQQVLILFTFWNVFVRHNLCSQGSFFLEWGNWFFLGNTILRDVGIVEFAWSELGLLPSEVRRLGGSAILQQWIEIVLDCTLGWEPFPSKKISPPGCVARLETSIGFDLVFVNRFWANQNIVNFHSSQSKDVKTFYTN